VDGLAYTYSSATDVNLLPVRCSFFWLHSLMPSLISLEDMYDFVKIITAERRIRS
jgi:hypothetical protein